VSSHRATVTIAAGVALAGALAFVARDVAAERLTPVEQDFLLSCAGCHGIDGKGSAKVPSLAGLDRVLRADGGREYLARVPGVAQAPLDDARLARLLNYVLAAFSGTMADPPYVADEIGRLRRTPYSEPLAVRRALLARTSDSGESP
jgi:mono/diheme cytochrome c family protein